MISSRSHVRFISPCIIHLTLTCHVLGTITLTHTEEEHQGDTTPNTCVCSTRHNICINPMPTILPWEALYQAKWELILLLINHQRVTSSMKWHGVPNQSSPKNLRTLNIRCCKWEINNLWHQTIRASCLLKVCGVFRTGKTKTASKTTETQCAHLCLCTKCWKRALGLARSSSPAKLTE